MNNAIKTTTPSRLLGVVSNRRFLCIALLGMCFLYCSCNTSDTQSVSQTQSIAQTQSYPLEMVQVKAIELPSNLMFRDNVGDRLVVQSMDQGQNVLCLYNPKTETLETLYSCPDGYHPTDVIANSDWIVWVECDAEYDNAGTEPCRWNMKALNIVSQNIYLVDSGSILEKFNVPDFINYLPVRMSLSSDKMVYCKSVPVDTKMTSQVVYYELNSQVRKVIQETDDVRNEWLYDCSIDNNKVAWSKFSILNYDTSFRMSQYKYSDIYLYDCDTQEVEQLTFEDFYCSPYLFEDKLALSKMPLTRPDQHASDREVALMDLKTRNIEIVVDRNSHFYEGPADGDIDRGDPIMNSRYISWNNTSFPNRNLVDYHNKKMIALELVDFGWVPQEGADEHAIYIVSLFDDAVLISVDYIDENTPADAMESRMFYVELP